MKKRLFAILAAMVMVVCLAPVTVFAEGGSYCPSCGKEVDVAFICDQDGHSTYCEECKTTLTEYEAHVVSSWTYNNDATCGKSGTQSGKCEKCPMTVTKDDPNHPATGAHTWQNGECTVCHAVCTNHTGGTATCTAAAVCTVCGQSYGETDQSNHSGTATWTTTATTHEKKWSCCHVEVVASEDHEWENGKCTVCDYVCLHTGGTATCTAQAECTTCGEAYGELASHTLTPVAAKAASTAETGNTEYWKCTVCSKYFSDEKAAKEITLEDTVIPKLPAITKGGDQTVTAGEKTALSFTSEAAFEEFIRVELDGKTVDKSNYTVQSGSTVVTLNADYVASLSGGEHALGIVSKNGTATAKFTVTEKAAETTDKTDKPVSNDKAKTPKTGDSSNGVLWLVLLLVSGGAVTAATLVSKKKTYNR